MRDGAAALNVLMAVLDEIVYESATNLFFMCQVFLFTRVAVHLVVIEVVLF